LPPLAPARPTTSGFPRKSGSLKWSGCPPRLKVREGGPLRDRPFDPPFTNRSLLVPTAWWREAPLREVPPTHSAWTCRCSGPSCRKAYGGWSSAEKARLGLARLVRDWDRDLTAKGSARLSVREALAAVGKLMDFQLDNHTAPRAHPYSVVVRGPR